MVAGLIIAVIQVVFCPFVDSENFESLDGI